MSNDVSMQHASGHITCNVDLQRARNAIALHMGLGSTLFCASVPSVFCATWFNSYAGMLVLGRLGSVVFSSFGVADHRRHFASLGGWPMTHSTQAASVCEGLCCGKVPPARGIYGG